jgi:hypothetical protein
MNACASVRTQFDTTLISEPIPGTSVPKYFFSLFMDYAVQNDTPYFENFRTATTKVFNICLILKFEKKKSNYKTDKTSPSVVSTSRLVSFNVHICFPLR